MRCDWPCRRQSPWRPSRWVARLPGRHEFMGRGSRTPPNLCRCADRNEAHSAFTAVQAESVGEAGCPQRMATGQHGREAHAMGRQQQVHQGGPECNIAFSFRNVAVGRVEPRHRQHEFRCTKGLLTRLRLGIGRCRWKSLEQGTHKNIRQGLTLRGGDVDQAPRAQQLVVRCAARSLDHVLQLRGAGPGRDKAFGRDRESPDDERMGQRTMVGFGWRCRSVHGMPRRCRIARPTLSSAESLSSRAAIRESSDRPSATRLGLGCRSRPTRHVSAFSGLWVGGWAGRHDRPAIRMKHSDLAERAGFEPAGGY